MTQVMLGNKHECRVCGAKFYDLGKPRAVCPQCGTDQKNLAPESKSSSRRRRASPAVKRPALVSEGLGERDEFTDDKTDLDVDLDALAGEDDEEEE